MSFQRPDRQRAPAVGDAAAVQVIAHRGSSHAVPEHTLAAYRQALAEGADGLECDVRLTRDGVLVCVHDRRIDRTSNGRGVVSTLELADLSELDFGSWHRAGTAVPDLEEPEEPDHDASRVLTLERLVQLVVDSDRPVQLHVETKHPTRYAGQVERSLVGLLRRYGLHERRAGSDARVTVMTFAATGLRRIRARAPALPTVLLFPRMLPWLRDGTLPSYADIAGPSLSTLRADPGYVRRVHRQGARVHVWTVDEPADIAFVLDLGVDAVITNRPTEALRQLGRG
jgi:glycerophosphoryl diester phosphodiesterase